MEQTVLTAGGIAGAITAILGLLTIILRKPAKKVIEKRMKRLKADESLTGVESSVLLGYIK